MYWCLSCVWTTLLDYQISFAKRRSDRDSKYMIHKISIKRLSYSQTIVKLLLDFWVWKDKNRSTIASSYSSLQCVSKRFHLSIPISCKENNPSFISAFQLWYTHLLSFIFTIKRLTVNGAFILCSCYNRSLDMSTKYLVITMLKCFVYLLYVVCTF